MIEARDLAIRLAAAEHLRRIATADTLSSEQLAAGFLFEGERVPLVNPQRGIFKPKAMEHLLSVRTVFPRSGARVWYDDQRVVHEQVTNGKELVDYAFMGDNPDAADNRWLRRAHEAQVPILYFLGVAPGRYTAIWPTFVAEWSAAQLRVRLAFGQTVQEAIPEAAERRYASRFVQQRLHQATFREAVLTAYGGRCAITRLPEPRLLDAAHIVVDGDERMGQPIVPNGLPLSKIHHAAFDANLIGIDADHHIHISEALLSINDGPMFEYGVKALAGRQIHLPSRAADHPSRDRLAQRFEEFRRTG
ncbi:MAG TPA: HNH endonuclease [Devosia sp.]|jgi:putative restriction endonuclease|uniref:HNH endonuclease n=1 Tax=Devosia sp. TaxID=1871048 RepID=UPI002DDCAC47|nr:HNH endonuclease [Devosia sp.]HEV2515159.1 HNH endonuclease [Devosia sp.]